MAVIRHDGVGSTMTAAMTLPLENAEEHFGEPLVIGYYHQGREIWIEGEGGRQNIPVCHLDALIKELRFAAKGAIKLT